MQPPPPPFSPFSTVKMAVCINILKLNILISTRLQQQIHRRISTKQNTRPR
ncbi:hypothetical protein HanIR_Chr16g0789951 [Helianthus annuus]|nr:hypothetical protein HanIR_Chr16g0789951 [Helianthus annuus]